MFYKADVSFHPKIIIMKLVKTHPYIFFCTPGGLLFVFKMGAKIDNSEQKKIYQNLG